MQRNQFLFIAVSSEILYVKRVSSWSASIQPLQMNLLSRRTLCRIYFMVAFGILCKKLFRTFTVPITTFNEQQFFVRFIFTMSEFYNCFLSICYQIATSTALNWIKLTFDLVWAYTACVWPTNPIGMGIFWFVCSVNDIGQFHNEKNNRIGIIVLLRLLVGCVLYIFKLWM